MKRKAGIVTIILLPILILGILVFNAQIMSAHYMILNGFDQTAKIYGEQFTVDRNILYCKAGQALSVTVTVNNTSNFIWSHAGSNPVHMSYRVLDANKRQVITDGIRTGLPIDLLPGQKVTELLQVKAPEQPGSYIVQLDMVQEGVTWFGEKSGDISFVKLYVQ